MHKTTITRTICKTCKMITYNWDFLILMTSGENCQLGSLTWLGLCYTANNRYFVLPYSDFFFVDNCNTLTNLPKSFHITVYNPDIIGIFLECVYVAIFAIKLWQWNCLCFPQQHVCVLYIYSNVTKQWLVCINIITNVVKFIAH